MIIDELEAARTSRYLIDSSGMKETKNLTFWQIFGIHFRYRHQLDDHNNWRHVPISLERTWVTKFWTDWKFSWYLAVSEVNIALASGHFQNDEVVQPSLNFWISLEMKWLENKIGFELGDNGRPKRIYKWPCHKNIPLYMFYFYVILLIFIFLVFGNRN